MTENEIATIIVDAAYKIHVTLGPGLLESVYSAAMVYELRKRGLKVAVEQSIPVIYDGVQIREGFRADLIIEDKVIVELKSVERVIPVHPIARLSGTPICRPPAPGNGNWQSIG